MAALGIRVLEMFVDAAVFGTSPQIQQRLFQTTDVQLTGAVLGGGSDALHHLVLVFANVFQTTAGRVKGEGGRRLRRGPDDGAAQADLAIVVAC